MSLAAPKICFRQRGNKSADLWNNVIISNLVQSHVILEMVNCCCCYCLLWLLLLLSLLLLLRLSILTWKYWYLSSPSPGCHTCCVFSGLENLDLEDYTVHVVAGVLKLFFRQLASPIVSVNLYQDFIRTAGKHTKRLLVHTEHCEKGKSK